MTRDRMPRSGESVEDWADRRALEDREAVRAELANSNHPDRVRILADYERGMREVDNGLKSARSCWHSISPKQAHVLAIVGAGGYLRRCRIQPAFYEYHGPPHAVFNLCGIKTVRNLSERDLLHVDGGAFDPEAKFIITERGRFVLRHGYTATGDWWNGDANR